MAAESQEKHDYLQCSPEVSFRNSNAAAAGLASVDMYKCYGVFQLHFTILQALFYCDVLCSTLLGWLWVAGKVHPRQYQQQNRGTARHV